MHPPRNASLVVVVVVDVLLDTRVELVGVIVGSKTLGGSEFSLLWKRGKHAVILVNFDPDPNYLANP